MTRRERGDADEKCDRKTTREGSERRRHSKARQAGKGQTEGDRRKTDMRKTDMREMVVRTEGGRECLRKERACLAIFQHRSPRDATFDKTGNALQSGTSWQGAQTAAPGHHGLSRDQGPRTKGAIRHDVWNAFAGRAISCSRESRIMFSFTRHTHRSYFT